MKRAVAVLLAVITMFAGVAGCGNEAAKKDDPAAYEFPGEKYDQIFFKCNDSPYNPENIAIFAQLMINRNTEGYYTCGEAFTLVKQFRNVWKIIPFAEGTAFTEIAFIVDNGMSFDYVIRPEMLSVRLDEGNYRIVTEIYHHEIEGATPVKHLVWADFTIDKDAPKPEVYDLTPPNEAPIITYSLENSTDRQRLECMLFVSLYSDGTAWLSQPPISSNLLPKCGYYYKDDELIIFASISSKKQGEAFGIEDGSIIARFTVIDENTIVLNSSYVPIFADPGARYVAVDTISPDSIDETQDLGLTGSYSKPVV